MIDPAAEARETPQIVEYGTPEGAPRGVPPAGTLLGPAPQDEADQILLRVLNGLMGRN
jgi:hypothetical protein